MKRGHIALATILLILWTAFLGYMFQRETALAEGRLKDIALSQARALFNQVVDLRDWNARHGGVYVPVTPETPPNPWLEVPHRDETTLSGRHLTLMNPAYMKRLAERLPKRKVTLLDTGCCGMAGAFGALESKYELSLAVAKPLMDQVQRQSADTTVVASGTSCRHQIQHLSPAQPQHMAELLAYALGGE